MTTRKLFPFLMLVFGFMFMACTPVSRGFTPPSARTIVIQPTERVTLAQTDDVTGTVASGETQVVELAFCRWQVEDCEILTQSQSKVMSDSPAFARSAAPAEGSVWFVAHGDIYTNGQCDATMAPTLEDLNGAIRGDATFKVLSLAGDQNFALAEFARIALKAAIDSANQGRQDYCSVHNLRGNVIAVVYSDGTLMIKDSTGFTGDYTVTLEGDIELPKLNFSREALSAAPADEVLSAAETVTKTETVTTTKPMMKVSTIREPASSDVATAAVTSEGEAKRHYQNEGKAWQWNVANSEEPVITATPAGSILVLHGDPGNGTCRVEVWESGETPAAWDGTFKALSISGPEKVVEADLGYIAESAGVNCLMVDHRPMG